MYCGTLLFLYKYAVYICIYTKCTVDSEAITSKAF